MTNYIDGMSNAAYRAIKGISRTDICNALVAPIFCKMNRPTTSGMKLGIRAHHKLLQPSSWADNYVIADPSIKTSCNKKFKELEESSGKEVLLESECLKLNKMIDACHSNIRIRDILKHATAKERVYFADCDVTGLKIKCMVDILLEQNNQAIIIDYKTTSCNLASVSKWSSYAYSMQYHVQVAHYVKTYELATDNKVIQFIFIAQETEEPYLTRIFNMPLWADESMAKYSDWMGIGMHERARGIHIINDCEASGKWPGYVDKDIVDMVLPKYAGLEF